VHSSHAFALNDPGLIIWCVYHCRAPQAHHRLAVAFFGLQLYSDAVDSYRRALNLEPDNQALQAGLHKVGGGCVGASARAPCILLVCCQVCGGGRLTITMTLRDD
jgi:hypothetical protein